MLERIETGASLAGRAARSCAALRVAPVRSDLGFGPHLYLRLPAATTLRAIKRHLHLSAGSMRHSVEFLRRVEVVHPCLLRANKYLPAWHQFVSLAKRSKAHVVGFWLIASRCRIDRRPAVRTESLQTDVSTIGGLSIFRRFAGQKHERAWMSNDDRSQWSAAHGLTVCAVANGRRFGIGFGLERHVAAVTASINFHDRFPGIPQIGMGC